MENSGGFSHDFFWNNGELYTEVIQVGSEKDKDEENVGHTDALPISWCMIHPDLIFLIKTELVSLMTGFMCQQSKNKTVFNVMEEKCNTGDHHRQLGEDIFKKKVHFPKRHYLWFSNRNWMLRPTGNEVTQYGKDWQIGDWEVCLITAKVRANRAIGVHSSENNNGGHSFHCFCYLIYGAV